MREEQRKGKLPWEENSRAIQGEKDPTKLNI
jgi:hypothetical protein